MSKIDTPIKSRFNTVWFNIRFPGMKEYLWNEALYLEIFKNLTKTWHPILKIDPIAIIQARAMKLPYNIFIFLPKGWCDEFETNVWGPRAS